MTAADRLVGSFFRHRARAMQNSIDATRDVITHALTKGVEAESALADLLVSFLPGRFLARKGFLIDSIGRRSNEVDLIIVDRHNTARMFDFNTFEVVPIEAASGGIEVKMSLDKAELDDTFKRFQQIHELHFNEERVAFIHNTVSSTGLSVGTTTRPDLSIFAFEGNLTDNAVKDVYRRHPDLSYVKVCMLQKGIVANISESSRGPLGLRRIEPVETDTSAFAGTVLSLYLFHLLLPALVGQRKGFGFYSSYLRGESVYRDLN